MRHGTIAGWALATVLTSVALLAMAQQEDGPILRPKKQDSKPKEANSVMERVYAPWPEASTFICFPLSERM